MRVMRIVGQRAVFVLACVACTTAPPSEAPPIAGRSPDAPQVAAAPVVAPQPEEAREPVAPPWDAARVVAFLGEHAEVRLIARYGDGAKAGAAAVIERDHAPVVCVRAVLGAPRCAALASDARVTELALDADGGGIAAIVRTANGDADALLRLPAGDDELAGPMNINGRSL